MPGGKVVGGEGVTARDDRWREKEKGRRKRTTGRRRDK